MKESDFLGLFLQKARLVARGFHDEILGKSDRELLLTEKFFASLCQWLLLNIG